LARTTLTRHRSQTLGGSKNDAWTSFFESCRNWRKRMRRARSSCPRGAPKTLARRRSPPVSPSTPS
jgi:hypothetical protein